VSRSFTPERSPTSAAANETSGRGEALRDRRPGQSQLGIVEGFADAAGGVFQHDGAVGDLDFGERGGVSRPAGLGPDRASQRVDQRRPVGAAVAIEADVDVRAHQRDVGDFDAAHQHREKPQACGKLVGGERGLGVVAERDIGEAD
jgi:hypothetical protein